MPAFHLISGLPRSGSTLLSAILKQNPRFMAGVTSPVAALVGALLPKMSGTSEFAPFFDDERRRRILRGLFDTYYGAIPAGHLVFDTNRSWTAKAALLRDLYPEARIVCLVREVGWIIDSIERVLRANPLEVSRMLNFQTGSSVYGRAELLMNSENGLVGLAWSSLREAWFSDNATSLIVIDYDRFTRDPRATIARLYAELKEPAFAHDFDNLTHDEPDYDATLGMPGLHTVRAKVEHQPRTPCIPPDIFANYKDTAFWTRPEMNRRGAVVL
ncbi:MAG: sulfotransferase [Caulobacteraceae bacterium]